MTPTTLFYILIAIIILIFLIEKIIGKLNAKHFNDALPTEVNDIYDAAEYKKSQHYKTEN